MITRRDLMKMGLLGTGTFLTLPAGGGYGRVSAFFDDAQRSPFLKPFVDPLPTLEPLSTPLSRPTTAQVTPYAAKYFSENDATLPPPHRKTQYFEIVAAERPVQFHRDLPDTAVWAYRDPRPSAVH